MVVTKFLTYPDLDSLAGSEIYWFQQAVSFSLAKYNGKVLQTDFLIFKIKNLNAMNVVFIGKLNIGINMKSLIVISCPLAAFLGDAENNDLKKYIK